MKPTLLAMAATATIALTGAAAAEPEAAAVAAAASASKPFMTTGPACGDAANYFYCFSLAPADNTVLKTTTELAVKFPGPGRAMVTWSGSTFCVINPTVRRSTSQTRIDYSYYVHLALKDDGSAIAYNDKGSATVGEENHDQIIAQDSDARRNVYRHNASRTDSKYVTLTRMFTIRKAGTSKYRGVVMSDFRTGLTGSYCNINGGVIDVQFFPD